MLLVLLFSGPLAAFLQCRTRPAEGVLESLPDGGLSLGDHCGLLLLLGGGVHAGLGGVRWPTAKSEAEQQQQEGKCGASASGPCGRVQIVDMEHRRHFRSLLGRSVTTCPPSSVEQISRQSRKPGRYVGCRVTRTVLKTVTDASTLTRQLYVHLLAFAAAAVVNGGVPECKRCPGSRVCETWLCGIGAVLPRWGATQPRAGVLRTGACGFDCACNMCVLVETRVTECH